PRARVRAHPVQPRPRRRFTHGPHPEDDHHMTEFDAREQAQQILDYCLLSMRYGLNFNTQGNISVRLPEEDRFMITPTDMEYDRMSADDMVVVDANANVIEGR